MLSTVTYDKVTHDLNFASQIHFPEREREREKKQELLPALVVSRVCHSTGDPRIELPYERLRATYFREFEYHVLHRVTRIKPIASLQRIWCHK